MKKHLVAALLLTAGLSMSAHAGLISGPQTFADGKIVNLQGLEWMPLTYTWGLSRNQVEAVGGFTDRFGGVWNASDWRYASRAETEALLGSLWGGRYEGFSTDNYDGAAAFFALFDPRQYNSYWARSNFAFGKDGDCDLSPTMTCSGSIWAIRAFDGSGGARDKLNEWEYLELPFTAANIGMFADDAGAAMGRTDDNRVVSKASSGEWSHLLVRRVDSPVTTVNAPSALSLFALGLCGLLLRRRKIAA